MNLLQKIDLHMHTTISDGTDTPEEILACVKAAGLELFSVTDHDAVRGCSIIQDLLREDDPLFLTGAEFSCKDEEGKYHVLGYGFDPEAEPVLDLVRASHRYRMNKVQARLDFLENRYGFTFPREELEQLYKRYNPGKPHIANLMVKYGFAKTKEEAIDRFINQIKFDVEYLRPEEAIAGILAGGGIPVLAHPSHGSGDQLIVGEAMDKRLRHLIGYGLRGVEACYSGFTEELQVELLSFAERYGLYVTAGSDYHGANKTVSLGDTHCANAAAGPDGLRRFLEKVLREN